MAAWTGKVDGSDEPQEHKTLAEAEAWIAEQEKVDPVGVHRGDYYIDADEMRTGDFNGEA